MSQTFKEKLMSRKFWLATAAAISTFVAGIQMLAQDNDIVGIVCIVLAALSAAIYEAVETVCDVKAMPNQSTYTSTTIKKDEVSDNE